jgi:hypothetical protein
VSAHFSAQHTYMLPHVRALPTDVFDYCGVGRFSMTVVWVGFQ